MVKHEILLYSSFGLVQYLNMLLIFHVRNKHWVQLYWLPYWDLWNFAKFFSIVGSSTVHTYAVLLLR